MRHVVTFLVCVCVASLPAFGRMRRIAPPAALSIVVFDYAGASRALPAAFRETERILAQSGVKLTFVVCPDSLAGIAAIPACTREPQSSSVLIDVLTRSATRRATEPNAFGFADCRQERGFPWFAGVFYDRVTDLSHARGAHSATILGVVIAHEIGHLLLGSAAHASFGVMTAHWTPKELLQLEGGRLAFSNSQAARIRANVIARNDQQREIYARDRADGRRGP